MNYEERLTADARLVMLRAMYAQTDYRLNEAILESELDRFGHRRSRQWVRTQLEALRELGAVSVTEAANVKIGGLTKLGIAHVERRQIIDGVARLSPEE